MRTLSTLWVCLDPVTWAWALATWICVRLGWLERIDVIAATELVYICRFDGLKASHPWVRFWVGYGGRTWGGLIVWLFLDPRRPEVGRKTLEHELRHGAQHRLLGPLFMPMYLAMWLFGLVVPGHRAYRDHPLEQDAREHAGQLTRRTFSERDR